MTRWRWLTISEEIKLTLELDSDDPELVARVEHSAESNGIVLERIELEDLPPPRDSGKPSP